MAHMNAQQFVILISLASFVFIPFPSSNESRYPCPDCCKGFTDPTARVKHRKTVHGYQPYHTPRYYARRALKEAEKRAKAAAGKTRDQQAANVFPRSTQSASSHHSDLWKLVVDVPRHDASEPTVSQEVQISAPVAVAPARDTPKTLCSDSDLSLPKVGQQPTTTQTGAHMCGPQLDAIVQPQSQALAQSWAACGHMITGAASDHCPFSAAFPTLGGQSTHPGTGFQSLPTFSFTNVPSFMPNSFNSPTTSTASSSSRISGPHFISPYSLATPPLEPVPALSWAPSLSSASSTPILGFDTWCQSHHFSREL
jgi:hypothetical protein